MTTVIAGAVVVCCTVVVTCSVVVVSVNSVGVTVVFRTSDLWDDSDQQEADSKERGKSENPAHGGSEREQRVDRVVPEG